MPVRERGLSKKAKRMGLLPSVKAEIDGINEPIKLKEKIVWKGIKLHEKAKCSTKKIIIHVPVILSGKMGKSSREVMEF